MSKKQRTESVGLEPDGDVTETLTPTADLGALPEAPAEPAPDRAASPEAPAEPAPDRAASPRVRAKGLPVKCPECGGDSFAVGTRTHPHFIERRIRRYRCGTCNTAFKKLVRVL